jgi:hypothetical protein
LATKSARSTLSGGGLQLRYARSTLRAEPPRPAFGGPLPASGARDTISYPSHPSANGNRSAQNVASRGSASTRRTTALIFGAAA